METKVIIFEPTSYNYYTETFRSFKNEISKAIGEGFRIVSTTGIPIACAGNSSNSIVGGLFVVLEKTKSDGMPY